MLFKTFNALSETLRSLVSSYYAVLLDQVIELLSGWSQLLGRGAAMQKELWNEVIRSIQLSAKHDEGVFWNPTRVAKIIAPVLDQMNLLSLKTRLVDPAEFVSVVGRWWWTAQERQRRSNAQALQLASPATRLCNPHNETRLRSGRWRHSC